MTDLSRFVNAQEDVYDRALAELRAGAKRGHWMWFVFPQIAGLGHSATAQRYAIADLDEARAYLAHPVLGPRLAESARALLGVEGRTAEQILGYPDDLKLRSSMTLFARAAAQPAGAEPARAAPAADEPRGAARPLTAEPITAEAGVFQAVLDRYYGGAGDPATLQRL